MSKKTKKIYVWLAVDRQRNKVIDFEVSESRCAKAFFPLAKRLRLRYKIDILCSDYYHVYRIYQIADKHYTTKSETSLVESKNSLIRHYLARFHRKTKRYSKAIDMIENSILMLFNTEVLLSIFCWESQNSSSGEVQCVRSIVAKLEKNGNFL